MGEITPRRDGLRTIIGKYSAPPRQALTTERGGACTCEAHTPSHGAAQLQHRNDRLRRSDQIGGRRRAHLAIFLKRLDRFDKRVELVDGLLILPSLD